MAIQHAGGTYINEIDLIGRNSTASTKTSGLCTETYKVEPNETIIGLAGSYFSEANYCTFKCLRLILSKVI